MQHRRPDEGRFEEPLSDAPACLEFILRAHGAAVKAHWADVFDHWALTATLELRRGRPISLQHFCSYLTIPL